MPTLHGSWQKEKPLQLDKSKLDIMFFNFCSPFSPSDSSVNPFQPALSVDTNKTAAKIPQSSSTQKTAEISPGILAKTNENSTFTSAFGDKEVKSSATSSRPRTASVESRSESLEQRLKAFDENIKKLASDSAKEPLLPLNETRHDTLRPTLIYLTDNLVFKPSEEAAVKSELCFEIARYAGLSHVVPISRTGHASIVVRQDEDRILRLLQTSAGQNDVKILVKKKNAYLIKDKVVDIVAGKVISCTRPKGQTMDLTILKDGTCEEANTAALEVTPPSWEIGSAFYLDEDLEGENKGVDSDFDSVDGNSNLDEDLDGENQHVDSDSDSSIEGDSDSEEEDAEISFALQSPLSRLRPAPLNIDDFEDEKPEISKNTSSVSELGRIDKPQRFVIAQDPNDKKYYAVPLEKQNKIENGDSGMDYVLEDNRKRYLRTKSGQVQVYEANVKGMVQEKIKDTFYGPTPGSSLNVLSPSQELTKFYKRIDEYDFIDCFWAIIFFRPQDANVTDLKESNVLFQMKDPSEPKTCMLRSVMIDFEEIMPDGKKYTKDRQLPPA